MDNSIILDDYMKRLENAMKEIKTEKKNKYTVGGLIGKTQYVNSWRDASYTTCKLDGTN